MLIRNLSQLSSWAECLDKDEFSFFEQVINNPLTSMSAYSKEQRDLKLTTFATILEAYSGRPRAPKRVIDYSVIRRRKDVQKMGVVVSALSSKKGLIPFSEDDLLKLKQLFSNTIRE